MFHTYILKSESNGKFYIGHSKDIRARIIAHNNNQNKSTKNLGPWKLVYTETFDTRSEAYKREMQIKKRKSRAYIETLIKNKF